VSIDDLGRDEWRRVLYAAEGDPPTRLNVADAFIERDLAPGSDHAEAERLVEDAITDGRLAGDPDAGAYGGVVLAEQPDSADIYRVDSAEKRADRGVFRA
jgi:hypothetical protein